MLNRKCDVRDIFFFAHPHFISLRFVRENRTPLGAFALLRQFLSLDSLLSLLVCFPPPPTPKCLEGFASTGVVIFN